MQEIEKRLKRVRALRKFREAEQLRLAAELHAHEQQLRRSQEASERATRFLDDELPLGGMLASHGLRAAAAIDKSIEEERRRIMDLSHRNVQSKSVKDVLVDIEGRLVAELEQTLADEALLETVAAWPSITKASRTVSD